MEIIEQARIAVESLSATREKVERWADDENAQAQSQDDEYRTFLKESQST